MNKNKSGESFDNVILKSTFVFIIYIFSVLMTQNVGVLDVEAMERIPNYLDGRNLFQKVYEIDKNEYGNYQARELSHFFDYVDANFIYFSFRLGLPNFYSLTYFVAVYLICFAYLHLARNYFKFKNELVPLLILFIFLYSPIIFFSTYMYRSAKILVGLGAVATVAACLVYLKNKKYEKLISMFVIFAGIFMVFGDRQGIYLLLNFAVLTLFGYCFTKKAKYLKLFGLLIISILSSAVYSYLIAPIFIREVIGHFPSFSYHLIAIRLIKPIYTISYTLDTFGFLFGGLNSYLTLILLVVLFLLLIKSVKPGRRLQILFIALFSLFSIFVLNALMISKHTAIVDAEVRRVYYSIPVICILLMSFLFFFAWFEKKYPRRVWLMIGFLAVFLTLNIYALGGHFNVIKMGGLKEHYKQSRATALCLRSDVNVGYLNLRADFKDFCELISNRKK